jgi:uncharacterized membrane protein YdjX (TVP38/TMEM64 family)
MTRSLIVRFSALALALLVAIILPFLLFGAAIEQWAIAFTSRDGDDVIVIALVAALLAADIVLPIPASVVMAAAPYSLGFLFGAVANFLGLTLGCAGGYAVGRYMGADAIRRFVGDASYARFQALVRAHGVGAIALCRAVPVLAEASVLTTGAARMPLRSFALACVLSNLAIATVYAAFGAFAAKEANGWIVFAASVGLPAISMLGLRVWVGLRGAR